LNVSLKTVITLLLLLVVVFLGCENPAGPTSDPNTLVLPGGTVSGAANGEYFFWYRGAGGEDNLTNQNFKRFTITDGTMPSIQLTLADVEDLLRPSNTTGNNMGALFGTGEAPTITPTVNMMRLQISVPVKADPSGGWSGTEQIVRANQSYIPGPSIDYQGNTYFLEWWYADGPATVSGEFYVDAFDIEVEATTNFQLQRGWNRIIYLADEDQVATVSTGQEPAGMGWHRYDLRD
jgi:hypothetical protein